jgi:uncharacterized membrane protein YsdA (DUF1294 family)
MVVFSWAVVSFCIELFCVVTLQYQILVRIAITYFIIEKKKAVNTKKTVRKNMLLRTVCIFGQFCKLEFIYSHNQSKSFCNYCNDKLHNEGFRLNLYSIPNRPIV